MLAAKLIEFFNTNGIFFIMLFAVGYPLLVTKNQVHTLKVLCALLGTFGVTLLLKELFSVTRPFLLENIEPHAGLTEFSSFPSSHTALAFAAATSVTFRKRAVGYLLLLIALAIGVGRVIANVHYPTDIVFGIIIGILISSFIENMKLPKTSFYKNVYKKK